VKLLGQGAATFRPAAIRQSRRLDGSRRLKRLGQLFSGKSRRYVQLRSVLGNHGVPDSAAVREMVASVVRLLALPFGTFGRWPQSGCASDTDVFSDRPGDAFAYAAKNAILIVEYAVQEPRRAVAFRLRDGSGSCATGQF
jgi:hypothetical protein